MSKTLITITGNWHKDYYSNWIECETTWVPKLREKGYDVLYLMSNPHLDKDYELQGNFFFSKCLDNKYDIYMKCEYFISKYVLNETEYQYRYHIDSDSFVHPDRFIKFIEDYTITNPKDYVGCAVPYPGLNWHSLVQKEFDSKDLWASGGSGFLLSRKSMKYLVEDFSRDEFKDTIFEDKIVGEILYRNGINLFHDSRLLLASPYRQTIGNPTGSPINFIGNKDSFLAVQHYCDGHMKELIHLLEL